MNVSVADERDVRLAGRKNMRTCRQGTTYKGYARRRGGGDKSNWKAYTSTAGSGAELVTQFKLLCTRFPVLYDRGVMDSMHDKGKGGGGLTPPMAAVV